MLVSEQWYGSTSKKCLCFVWVAVRGVTWNRVIVMPKFFEELAALVGTDVEKAGSPQL